MPRGKAWTQEETDILIEDRAQGYNCVEIGSKLGKSPNAVRVRSYAMGLGNKRGAYGYEQRDEG